MTSNRLRNSRRVGGIVERLGFSFHKEITRDVTKLKMLMIAAIISWVKLIKLKVKVIQVK